jgi:alcohol dehydrogenase, propanol-preferring
MKAYRLSAPGDAAVVDVDPPRPGPDEVLLRVLAAGVCRTDVTLIGNGGAGAIRLPVTLGHEITGQVTEVGDEVRTQRVGANVAVYELRGCGRCIACSQGEDNLCREISPGAFGITQDGGMAEYVVVPARNLVDLGGLDPAQAAPMTDAGMTALHAIERGRPLLDRGAVAVVVGIGGLGHLALQFLTSTSEATVIAVDADRARLELGSELGAQAAVLSGDGAFERILDANRGRKVDVVFDFVGAQETLDIASRATRRGGGIVIVGGGGGRLCLTAQMGAGAAPDREVTIVHTFGGTRRDLEKALALVADGQVDSRTETFSLEDADRAIGRLRDGRVVGRAVLLP